MNPVLIVVIIVLALLGIKGAFKGLFKILFSIVTLIACILIAGFITVPVANGLKANTGMYDGIDGFVYDTVKDNKNLNNKIDSSFALMNIYSEMTISAEYVPALESNATLIATALNANIDGYFLPPLVKDNLKVTAEDVNENIKAGRTVKDTVIHTFSQKLSWIIYVVIIFIILFIILEIIFWIIFRILNVFSRLPGLSTINRIGGFAIGIFEGLLIVWLGFMVLTLFAGTAFGMSCFEQINSDAFLSFIYNNNLIMKLLGFA